MSPIAILKLLKTAKKVHQYVVEANTLDHQMEMVLNRLAKLEGNANCCKCKSKKKGKKK